jgi:hypothetical protein
MEILKTYDAHHHFNLTAPPCQKEYHQKSEEPNPHRSIKGQFNGAGQGGQGINLT